MSPYKILCEVMADTSLPMLEHVSYKQAHNDFQWKVTRNVLSRCGYGPQEASRLAAEVSGSPKDRLEELIDRKYISAS